GLVTIAATSFINNSHNARMVAELAGISKKLIGETEFPAGNFCMEDGSDEAKKLLDFLEMEKAPAHPLYNGGTHLTTNECFLYFSDGEHYSIRVPTVGNKGYLIQESRNPNPQGIQEKCEEGWIPFGNRCVMKYEAKNVGGVATSQATVAPWVGISQENAKKKCEEIGAHLITNAEWMALARDIEAVEDNWVGTGASRVLKMGNAGNRKGNNTNNTEAWYGFDTPSVDYEGKTGGNRSSDSPAKLILSNGQSIWDFSGNVSEWIDIFYPTQAGITGGTNGGYGEINAIDWENSTNPYISYTEVGSKDQSLTSSNGIGQIYKLTTDKDKGLLRGGYFNGGIETGVFMAYMHYAVSYSGAFDGFRCVR
ncbi:MAG: SUMF1/EgtB/PvdO family nonheme iron enzyme, partial [Candidatus Pacebacteria bacterium]|nr:SUMF1/EgtB/PvdO family nonheme iron enzyme [Candidatus Paceibacterota bacterium]